MVVGKLDVLVRRGRCATLELCAQAWDIFDALQTERRIPIKALFRIGRDVIRLRTGETTGQVLSCETGLIPRCRSHSVEEKATSSHGEMGLHGKNLAQSETLGRWGRSVG